MYSKYKVNEEVRKSEPKLKEITAPISIQQSYGGGERISTDSDHPQPRPLAKSTILGQPFNNLLISPNYYFLQVLCNFQDPLGLHIRTLLYNSKNTSRMQKKGKDIQGNVLFGRSEALV